jgi:hypothetical protein
VRLQIHRAQLPGLPWIGDTLGEPEGLLLLADLEPVFDDGDAGIDDVPLLGRAKPEKPLVLLVGANPIIRSTPARLYQLRSNRTISPAAEKCSMFLLHTLPA